LIYLDDYGIILSNHIRVRYLDLDNATLFAVFGWGFLLITWYSLWNIQGKIKCQFHRKDRTVIDKTIRMTDKTVKFDKGSYDINPRRFSIKWVKVLGFFPCPMLFQEWKWDTDQPLDPSTFENSVDSPEARHAADSEKDWKGFNQGVDNQLGKKQGSFEKWLPWITIGAVVICAFLVYQLSGKLGIIEQQIQSLGAMIQKAGIK
jgi:hypothetical protein